MLYIYNILFYIIYMKVRKLHNRISALRREKGVSRKELAGIIGVNYQTVGYLEREEYNPSLDLAFRISEYFEAPIEFVFSTEPMKPMSRTILEKQEGG